jgi:hypothetical protein
MKINIKQFEKHIFTKGVLGLIDNSKDTDKLESYIEKVKTYLHKKYDDIDLSSCNCGLHDFEMQFSDLFYLEDLLDHKQSLSFWYFQEQFNGHRNWRDNYYWNFPTEIYIK